MSAFLTKVPRGVQLKLSKCIVRKVCFISEEMSIGVPKTLTAICLIFSPIRTHLKSNIPANTSARTKAQTSEKTKIRFSGIRPRSYTVATTSAKLQQRDCFIGHNPSYYDILQWPFHALFIAQITTDWIILEYTIPPTVTINTS